MARARTSRPQTAVQLPLGQPDPPPYGALTPPLDAFASSENGNGSLPATGDSRDQPPVEAPTDALVLNVTRLADVLGELVKSDSVVSLRQQLGELRVALEIPTLDQFGIVNTRLPGDAATLDRRYMFDQLQQIADSHTIERARYYLERFARALTEVRTSDVNDINLNRWQEYDDILTDSLWVLDKRDSSGVHSAGYWGNFIPQIPNQMIRRYTKRGEWVLDTFLGCGTTLIEAQRLGRNGIGSEIQPSIAEKARELVASEPNPFGVVTEVVAGDSAEVDFRSLLQQHQRASVQLLVMHPPYFDIIKFSDNPKDLSNASSVDEFLTRLGEVVDNASPLLDKGRYLVLVIGDKYSKGEWIPLGFLAMNEVLRRGFSLKSIIVKNFDETTAKRNQKKLWRYRALVGGFYIFKHEYVFLFRKK